MFKIPKKFSDRLKLRIKHFQTITASHRSRDVSEADTVTVVKDILADIFGYDKYHELTSEQQIRGTFCDLAIKIEGKIRFLIEVKSAGIELNDNHLRQALNYGANQGIEWVALTNSIDWRIFKIKFGQPVDFEQVTTFTLSSVNPNNEDDQKKLYLLAREGIATDAINTFHATSQVLNKFTVASLLQSDPVLSTLRREFRRFFPDIKIETEALSDMLANEIFKREVVDGEKVKEAQARLKKASQKLARSQAKADAATKVSDEVI